MATASIQDELDNLWLAEELPKILEKVEKEKQKDEKKNKYDLK